MNDSIRLDWMIREGCSMQVSGPGLYEVVRGAFPDHEVIGQPNMRYSNPREAIDRAQQWLEQHGSCCREECDG